MGSCQLRQDARPTRVRCEVVAGCSHLSYSRKTCEFGSVFVLEVWDLGDVCFI